MSIPTRNYIYGLSPLKRENPARGQSEWYYFDPRNASTFSDFKQIDVPSQNTPNPYAKEIQNYIFKTDSDNYKLLYGNAQPPQENQQNQPQQPENNTAKPIFSNQQNNQIFSQPQNAAGQAIGNNVEQSSQASVQNLNGTIKSTMPQATANAQNMNYIEQIKNILGDGGKDTQSILGTLPNIDNARSYATDDGGRQLNRNYLQELAEKRKNKNIYQIEKIGNLSSKHESLKDPSAIGVDNAGGPSYGTYQISTKTGTMSKYLNFLKSNYPEFYNELYSAGGNAAALVKNKEFVDKWRELSQNAKFNGSQYDFMISTHYAPTVERIKNKQLLDLENRNRILKDVIYSMSVQHRKASDIINSALFDLQNKYGDNNVDDETLIKTLYQYRHNYVENLPEHSEPGDNRITRQEKLNILNNRYPNELKDALECLKNK